MTRINCIPVTELHDKHLGGEYHEITRVFNLVQNAVESGKKPFMIGAPFFYTMGTGHVKFFYNKLTWVARRYEELAKEMKCRGMNPNPIPIEQLGAGIPSEWWNDWIPTLEAMAESRERISHRLKDMGVL